MPSLPALAPDASEPMSDALPTAPASPKARKVGRPRKPESEVKTARIMVVATPAQHRLIRRRAGAKSMSSYLLEGGVAGWARNAHLVIEADLALQPVEQLIRNFRTALPPGLADQLPPEIVTQIDKAWDACKQIRTLLREI